MVALINQREAVTAFTALMFGAIGLIFPDIDLRMLSVLHHRSIVTHNVFIPMLLLLVRNQEVRIAATAFILGESIHLAADVLSRPVGFGQVWLPYPLKLSLGSLSPLWLATNALTGLVVSRIVLTHAPVRLPLMAYIVLAGVFALSYAVWHEKSLRAFLSFTLIFCLSFALLNWLSSKPWFKPLPWIVR